MIIVIFTVHPRINSLTKMIILENIIYQENFNTVKKYPKTFKPKCKKHSIIHKKYNLTKYKDK